MTSTARVLLLMLLCTPAVADVPARPMTPVDAIPLAAASPQSGVEGTFLLTVQASGKDKRRHTVYLNSELDYRDQRNLTIDVEPPAFAALRAVNGVDLEHAFLGKRILVSGTARRVKIIFGKPRFSAVDGTLRNKYYYQTHVAVLAAEQLRVVPQAP